MGSIKSEKRVVSHMIELYCKHKLRCNEMPQEYKELEVYAHKRLDFCKFGNEKSFCSKCPIHCYKKDMKAKVKDVMRFSGPRLIIYSPIQFIKHIFE
jgi:hypothetical protein